MSMADYDLYERDEPAVSGVERDLYDAVSAEEPWALVERFADLERVSGSDDEAAAAEYLLERLDALGIEHDRLDPELYLSIPRDASLSAAGESFDAVKTVAFGGGQASGSLATFADEEAESHEDLLGTDVGDVGDLSGEVALISGMLPIDAIGDLERSGVEGVIVQHPHEREPHEGIATPVWGGAPEPGQADRIPDVPVVVVAAPVGERLRDLDDGTDIDLAAETETGWFECPLVTATVRGGADPDDDDFVLLHGHIDSWHVGVGDNATGDAGLLEAARVLDAHSEHLARDLRVAWWPGHSTGRYAGSTWYAEEFALEIEERCIAQVNMDSPGAADATEFQDMLCWMPEADDLGRGAIADVCGKDSEEHRPPRAGDYSFNNLGVTSLFMLSSNIPREVREARGYHAVGGCGGHADAWHLSTDTLEKADPEVLVRDVRVYVVALARLLRDAVPPLDFRHTVERHAEVLADYDAAAGAQFDLSPVRDELDALAEAVDEFYRRVDAGEIPPAQATECLKTLSRALVRVNFTTAGKFEQDPAVDRPPYPGLAPAGELANLAGDDRKFQLVALRRERNRAVALLREARRALPPSAIRNP